MQGTPASEPLGRVCGECESGTPPPSRWRFGLRSDSTEAVKDSFRHSPGISGQLGISGVDNSEKPESADEKRFNETLKRMLETPPKPQGKTGKDKEEEKPERKKPAK
jgi:hypothetical protein